MRGFERNFQGNPPGGPQGYVNRFGLIGDGFWVDYRGSPPPRGAPSGDCSCTAAATATAQRAAAAADPL